VANFNFKVEVAQKINNSGNEETGIKIKTPCSYGVFYCQGWGYYFL